MNQFKLIGRIIFAIPFAVFGLMHIFMADKMAGLVPAYIPGGIFWVYLTGLGLLAASVSFIINKMTSLAAVLLSIMLLIFVVTLQIPALFNPKTMQMAMGGLLKDLSLAGAALFFSGYFSEKVTN